MPVSKVDICNQALSHLGISTEINDFDTERSKEAQACRRFYDSTLEEVLREFAWPFATRTVALGLVSSDPTTEWKYSYSYPADALSVRRILSGTSRLDSEMTHVPLRVVSGVGAPLLYTDLQDAYIEYTYRETDTSKFPPDFVNAFAYLLASKIGPRVAGGDQFKLADRAYQFYQIAIGKARTDAANEETDDADDWDAEMIRARN